MEVYTFTQIAYTIVGLFVEDIKTLLIASTIVGAVLWIALFVLQGAGLYRMAKNRGMKKKALAFVPFVNIWYIGKLAGECKVFGHKMKHAGVYAMIAQILATLVTLAYIAAELYLWIGHGQPTEVGEGLLVTYDWLGLTGFAGAVEKFYCEYASMLMMIFQTIFGILMLIVLMSLFKKYAPKNYFLFSFLALFIPISRFITIFAVRNHKAIDYDAYVRAQREAYMRRQQYHYGYGPYGNPYNNPYGQPPYGAPQPPQQPPEEPFGEFDGKKDDSPFEEFGSGEKHVSTDGKSDDFFN